MKKYLVFLVCILISFVAYTQDTTKHIHETAALMPDLSFKRITFYGDSEALNQFNRIAHENLMNIAPLLLQSTKVPQGEYLEVYHRVLTAESDVYRFIANQLDKHSSVKKVISKKENIIFFTTSPTGTINIVSLYWDNDPIHHIHNWCICIHPNVGMNYTFPCTQAHTIFY